MPRRTKYSKKMLRLAEELARKGNNNREIAQKLGIHEDTFYTWLKKYSEFSETIKKAREEYAIPEIEGALFKKATGYWIEETKIRPDGKIETIKKYIPPDTTAIIFFLKNRAPERWRDRTEINASGKVGRLIVEAYLDED